MTGRSLDVRDSTLQSLRLTCPSADLVSRAPHHGVVGAPHSDLPDTDTDTDDDEELGAMPPPARDPFRDADAEWSDEEELLPRQTRKAHYLPPHVTITAADGSSSDEHSSASASPNRLPTTNSPSKLNTSSSSRTASPLLPPKSPSRPEIRAGSSHDDLIQRFYQVTRERDALRKELQRKSLTPSGHLATPNPAIHLSDEKTLIDELHALRYEIRIWAETHFRGHLGGGLAGAAGGTGKRPHWHRAHDVFGGLTDNYRAYLEHPVDRPLLIQAWVWSKLQAKVFSNWRKGCGYVWAGKLGDRKLRAVNDVLRKAFQNESEATAYHNWRATTINLLVPQVNGKWRPTFDAAPVLSRISRFCSRLRSKLRPWATHSLRDPDGKEQLRTIVSASVALDLKMKRQVADYRFVTFLGGREDEFFGYPFYESEMEDIYEDASRSGSTGPGLGGSVKKGRRVEMAIAPALERCGNANGHVFDQSFVLVKADVSCKRVERGGGKKKRGGVAAAIGGKGGVGRGKGGIAKVWSRYV